MNEQQRPEFNQALDTLALALGSTPISPEGKKEYWKALESHRIDSVMAAIAHLRGTFRPHWRDHYPAPAEIVDAVIITNRSTPEPPSQDYEAIKAGFKKRGILIGEEARIRLEADYERRMKTAREGLAEDYQA